ncbi:membrane protein, partial [Streptomyces sp. NRRL F-6602]
MTEKQNPPAEGHAFQDEVTELEAKSATAARLFDIRRIIGALFVVYGLIVGAAGI